MHNDEKIYEIKKDIDRNKAYLNLKIHLLEKQEEKLMDLCGHSLVFSLNDSKLHKNSTSVHFCPACLKKVKVLNNKKSDDYPFKDSHRITLGHYNLANYPDIYECIQEIVFTDPLFYYNFNIIDDDKIMELNALLAIHESIKPRTK